MPYIPGRQQAPAYVASVPLSWPPVTSLVQTAGLLGSVTSVVASRGRHGERYVASPSDWYGAVYAESETRPPPVTDTDLRCVSTINYTCYSIAYLHGDIFHWNEAIQLYTCAHCVNWLFDLNIVISQDLMGLQAFPWHLRTNNFIVLILKTRSLIVGHL